MKNIIKILLFNIVLFLIFIIIYYASAFLSGFASNNSHEAEGWWMYVKFTIAHLVINILFLEFLLKELNLQNTLISSTGIIILYEIGWIYIS